MTKHGELANGRFNDPRSKKSFHYDHLRKVRTDNIRDLKIKVWPSHCKRQTAVCS